MNKKREKLTSLFEFYSHPFLSIHLHFCETPEGSTFPIPLSFLCLFLVLLYFYYYKGLVKGQSLKISK